MLSLNWVVPVFYSDNHLGRLEMPDEYLASLRRLVDALDGFLDSGCHSSMDRDDDPPDRDDVREGGDVHRAIVETQGFFKSGKLPAPDARTPWVELCHARDNEKDPRKWQELAFKHAGELREWALYCLSGAKEKWSTPKPPSELAKLFDMSWDTVKRRIKDGSIRAQRLSAKSYRIHVDDLPRD